METNQAFKRLYWDIEVSANVGLFWKSGFDQHIGHDAILKERKIICISWIWEGEKIPHVIHWDHKQDDFKMLKEFLEVANEADELVAHFGDMFDVKWFRTRCLILGFNPIPTWKTVDTKAWASKYYYFNNNKLDYLSKVLGYGGKLKTDFDLWKDVMAGDLKALKQMCDYCAVDVLKLRSVFKRLEGCAKPKTNISVLNGGQKYHCPFCASKHVIKSKTRVSSAGTVTHQFRCVDCKKYYIIGNRDYESYSKDVAARLNNPLAHPHHGRK